MARDTKKDLELLTKFLAKYSFKRILQDKEFAPLLSSQHKLYYALLTLVAEIRHQNIEPAPTSSPTRSIQNIAFSNYLAECVSDLGTAFFVWLHGPYKGSRQILRSGIENYFKSVGVIEDESILRLKNTYEVIEIAGSNTFFKSPENHRLFQTLSSIYSELCRDVHTATISEMEHNDALGHFPKFSKKQAQSFEKLFRKSSISIISTMCLMFPNAYRKMHFKNRDIVASVLPAAIRRVLNS
jgi:hypothetical protein